MKIFTYLQSAGQVTKTLNFKDNLIFDSFNEFNCKFEDNEALFEELGLLYKIYDNTVLSIQKNSIFVINMENITIVHALKLPIA